MRLSLRLGLLAGLIAGACFSERPDSVMDPASGDCRIAIDSPVIGSVGAVVAMRDFAFHPNVLRVPRGTRVTWVNCEPPGTEAHTTTSDTNVWGSSLMTMGATFSRVFDQVGQFPYHCIPHASFMRATVIVE